MNEKNLLFSVHNKSQVTNFWAGTMFSIPIEPNKSAEKMLNISDAGADTSVLHPPFLGTHGTFYKLFVFMPAGSRVLFLFEMKSGLRGTIISKPRI